jgi:predicted secreted hydrolase
MKNSSIAWFLLFLAFQPAFAQYQTALPGYDYHFPRDHFSHPDYQTEWWYYIGNLKSSDGHRFGFELTFFRQAIDRKLEKQYAWDVQDVYLAHLALSDLDGGKFYHAERTNRAGPGLAGVDEKLQRTWNGNWKAQWRGNEQELQAMDERFSFSLSLSPAKSPVIHGENGLSQKAAGPGHASHYISFTRLITSGTIQLNGEPYSVTGLSWMDHEFFTHQLAQDQTGWDWLSLQLSDNSEIMLYRIRKKDGTVDPFSSATYVDPQGKSFHLRAVDFSLHPTTETWESPATAASYPIHWKIEIPTLNLQLEVSTLLPSQELAGQTNLLPAYWEGAITISGTREHTPLTGVGYLEMTGYAQPVEFGL